MDALLFAAGFALADDAYKLCIAAFMIALLICIWWVIRQPLKTERDAT